MDEIKQVGKRNKRNPGHCWQDNELYDVFQPVIGALAAHVFAQMTRWCYGHEVRMGLRELAEEAAVSRNTAHRATLAMQALGMIRIRDGRGRAAASYELLDLKEAAHAIGAQWDARRCSFALNAGQVRTLKKRVADAMGAVSLCVPVRDASESEEETLCVPEGDANECGNSQVVSQVVSQNRGVCVPKTGSPYISKDTKTNTNPSPTPSRREGGEVPETLSEKLHREGAEAFLRFAVDRVCQACGVTEPRVERAIGRALEKYCVKERMSADEAADAMTGAWHDYCEALPMLRFAWGPRKFFCLGIWLHPDAWPYDLNRMEAHHGARVGAA